MYLNGEKCVSSCNEIDLYEYKNECINKTNDNTYTDDKTNINTLIDDKTNDNTYIDDKTNVNTFIDNKSNDNTYTDDKTNVNNFIDDKSNYNTYIDDKTNVNTFIDNKSNDNTFIGDKSNYNTFIDNCTYNKNITNINTYQKTWVDICPDEYIYKYEFNKICYLRKINKFIQTCYITKLLKGLCIVNIDKDNDNYNNPEEKDIMISNIRKLIKDSNMPVIFDGENKGIFIKDTDIIYQIIPTTNQKNSINDNISTIYLDECEKKLKKHSNISEKESFFIFKMDIYREGSSIPIIEYEVYDLKTKNLLNLSICNDTKIQILVPVMIDEKNINKYNSSDEYYNNICYTYTTESGTDIILTDRKNEFIINNMSICETKCEYEGYEFDSKKVICECEVKNRIPFMSEVTINKNILINKLDIKNSLNIKILKCYKLLFSKSGLKNNIGSYIILSIIFIITICLILFLYKDYYKIIDIISKIVSYNKNKIISNKNLNNNNKTKKISKKGKKSKKKKKKKINDSNVNLVIMNNKTEISNKMISGHSPPKNRAKTNRKVNYYISNLQTKGEDLNGNSSFKLNKKDKKKDKIKALNIPKISIEKDNINMLLNYNDYEINNLTYKKAIKFDKRGYIDYYFSLLRRKQVLIFSFYTYNDYNSKMIKISIFLFSFALYFTVTALFYSDSTMHKIYEDNGKFNFIYKIPQIIYSTLISSVINLIVSTLSITERNILSLKKEKENLENQKLSMIKFVKIKYISFFIIIYLFLGLFWYYISCFCAVYKNTQIHLIKDTVISFVLGLLYPIFLCLIPGIFRIPALTSGKNSKECLYMFSKIMQLI